MRSPALGTSVAPTWSEPSPPECASRPTKRDVRARRSAYSRNVSEFVRPVSASCRLNTTSAPGWSTGSGRQSPLTDSRAERNERLVLASIRALGISGNKNAAAALTSLQRGGYKIFVKTEPSSVDSSVIEALKANQEVRNKGLASYLSTAK